MAAIKNSVPTESKYNTFFLCAFSNILKPTSRWLTKSIKPQVDPEKKPAKIIPAFKAQVRFMRHANDENDYQQISKSEILNANILDDSTVAPKVDLIITSPPYVTSYEYADLHQLSSLWLGFAEDYRDLRHGSIGSVFHDYNFNRELKRVNDVGTGVVCSLFEVDKRKARAVAKYYLDMQAVSKKCFSMLSETGMAVFVIGNTEYKGVKVTNAEHLTESLLDAGFKNIGVSKRKISQKILTPYRDDQGRFTTDEDGHKVYSEEFILIARKK